MTATTDVNALFRAFLASLVVVSLPIKNFAYVAPAVYLLILGLHGEYRLIGRVALLSSAIVAVSMIAMFWDHLSGQAVNLPGLWFGLVTYAPLIIVLCETFNRTVDDYTYEKFARVCAWYIVFQSFVGLLQFAVTRNPDAVCGTFGLFDGFRQGITIAQVYFTFTIFGMILFIAPVASQWLPRVAIALGVLICVMAQSGHQLIFFVTALVACGMTQIARLGTLARTIAASAVMALLVLQFYPDTVWLAREWYHKVTDASQSPKRLALEGAIDIIKEPKNLLIGTGLGQFSSRAALISSNEYLNVKLPGLLTSKSDYFDDHIGPSLLLFEAIGEGSAIAKPYMSAISLPVELGLVLTLILLAVVGYRVAWCAMVTASRRDQVGLIGFAMMVGIIFFLLCCLIENYAEFTQAIFVPFILFVVAGSRAQTALRCVEIRAKSRVRTRNHRTSPRATTALHLR